MNSKFSFALLALLLPLAAVSQDFKKQFTDAQNNGDKPAQEKVLKTWEAKNPNDAELYVTQFNYHVNKGRSEVLALTKQQQSGESLVLQDSTGSAAGYMGSVVNYDPVELKNAIDAIDKGISLHPKRLDMRFGKIYLLSEAKRYDDFTTDVVKAVDQGKTKHDWLWKEGKPLPDAERFFLENIQGYVGMIYNTEDDALLPKMRDISQAVLKYYPNHVESLSNIAITHLLVAQYDEALPYLLHAEKSNPKDTVVLNNIAEAYKRSGKTTEAKKYYEKMIIVGDDRDKAYAREMINTLD